MTSGKWIRLNDVISTKNVVLTFGNFRQRRVGHGKPAYEPQGKGLECDAARLSRGIELTGIDNKLPNPPLALGIVFGHKNQRLNKLLSLDSRTAVIQVGRFSDFFARIKKVRNENLRARQVARIEASAAAFNCFVSELEIICLAERPAQKTVELADHMVVKLVVVVDIHNELPTNKL